MSKKIHKLVYIPYTGVYQLCTGSDRWKLRGSHNWRKVTCKHCKNRKHKEFWPS